MPLLTNTSSAMGYNARDADASSKPFRSFPVPGNPQVTLQQLIDQNPNGARIRLAGDQTYTFSNVELTSDIHLRIPSSARLRVTDGERTMFFIGRREEARNVSITSTSGRFLVDFRNKDEGERVVFVATFNANNVKIANCTIRDNLTLINSIVPQERAGNLFTRRLTVSNVRQFDGNGGYGIVQPARLRDAVFSNLNGRGGITLRLEPGQALGNQAYADVRADNITGIDGRAAVSLSPHSADGVRVNIDNVVSDGCAYGVLAPNGFGSRVGKFTETEITDIDVTYSDTGGQERLRKRAERHRFRIWDAYTNTGTITNSTTQELVDLAENLRGPTVAGILTPTDPSADVTINGPVQFHDFPRNSLRRADATDYLDSSVISARINALD